MGPVRRLARKLESVRRYPRLASGAADSASLWLLGLHRNRVPGSGIAAGILLGVGRVIAPRLAPARGQRIRVDLGQAAQIDVFDELLLEGIYDLAAVTFGPSLVVDCGAFCGYFSAMASGFFPGAHIACSEANPANIGTLEAQLALLDRKVEMTAAAVHLQDGFADFAGEGMGGALVGAGAAPGSLRVPSVDFPRWLRERAPKSMVWKLEVEGAEADLLAPTLPRLPRRTACFLETHHPDRRCDELLGPYRDAGFEIHEVRRRTAPAGGFDYVEWLLVRSG